MSKYITWYMIAVMLIISFAPRAEAAFSPSRPVSLLDDQRDSDIKTIQSMLEMKLLKQRLADLGYSTEEIKNRLDRLNDEQIHALALKIDALKAGGNGLGVIIALLVIAILVVLLIQLSGHRVVIQ